MTLRIPEEMGEILDERDGSNNAFIVEAIEARLKRLGLVEPGSDGRIAPEEAELAAAYDTLLGLTRGGGVVELETAESTLAQEHGYRKNLARYRLILPLEERGYCTILQGMNQVRLKVHA